MIISEPIFIIYFSVADLLNLRVWHSSSVVADLLVSNGTIYTSDASLPFADSMAIRNGRILRIGNYSFVKVTLTLILVFIYLCSANWQLSSVVLTFVGIVHNFTCAYILSLNPRNV